MTTHGPDPYQTLGVSPSVSDDEVRTAYRHLVQEHHPDHNDGSAESARRFEEVQEAYSRIRELRTRFSASGPGATRSPKQPHAQRPPGTPADAQADSRLADLEREIREAQLARERARQAAREAASAEMPGRASDEELGYVTTNDSFSKILADARSGVRDGLSDAREPVAGRVADLIDELASKLKGDRPSPQRPGSRE